MAVVDCLLVYVGNVPASLNSDRCYLMVFSGSRGTISEAHTFGIRRALNTQAFSGSNILPAEPLLTSWGLRSVANSKKQRVYKTNETLFFFYQSLQIGSLGLLQ